MGYLGFPDSSVGKEFACNAGDPGSIPGLGRSTGEGIGYSLQYSWASIVPQLVKNPPIMQETWVRSLGREEKISWRRERLPTPVFWPREFHGLFSPWGRKESDMTERLLSDFHFHFHRGIQEYATLSLYKILPNNPVPEIDRHACNGKPSP